ncbi:hypothetical protein EG349_12635 [Chryseobacterium shandongense]|uniref:Uncharacterized protein n=1 Tax=Chryseobacterium shandongense TaxID=1493872 RepID=A0AAD1DMA4_9FLAO|nr:hypothetical protein [Chryseobacterium shandongense]AZA87576.1 hypothetical protein EG349_12635 [Chryseobacterium shandongense]AZA96076.1 hypothetical protein EG353_11095 [Chryseobacterium shandongense]
MNDFIKQTGQKWLERVAKNPKRFYIYSMIFLSVSFIGSLIQDIFFPSQKTFTIIPPVLYSNKASVQDTEMEKIVSELKLLKDKRDRNALQKADSLRIEFLFNRFQQLKNSR